MQKKHSDAIKDLEATHHKNNLTLKPNQQIDMIIISVQCMITPNHQTETQLCVPSNAIKKKKARRNQINLVLKDLASGLETSSAEISTERAKMERRERERASGRRD